MFKRGSPRLKLNELARELVWFGLGHDITLNVEWVPREENALADELSKLIISDSAMLSRTFFQRLEQRWGNHTVELFYVVPPPRDSVPQPRNLPVF